MKIFGIQILWNRDYQNLLNAFRQLTTYKQKVEGLLKRGLPLIADRTLKNKRITLSRGLVLVNSTMKDSKIDYKAKTAVEAFDRAIITNCYFKGK